MLSAPATNHAPGGESLADVQRRASDALSEVIGALGVRGADPAPDGFPRSFVSGYVDSGAERRPVEPWAVLVEHDGVFRVLMLTLFDAEAYAGRAFGLGADGFCMKDAGRDDIVAAIYATLDGRRPTCRPLH
jgi:hypothetical protein